MEMALATRNMKMLLMYEMAFSSMIGNYTHLVALDVNVFAAPKSTSFAETFTAFSGTISKHLINKNIPEQFVNGDNTTVALMMIERLHPLWDESIRVATGEDPLLRFYNPFKPGVQGIILLANNGHAGAQHKLGAMYFNGQGVQIDYRLSFEWQQKAASQGHPNALFDLGWLYHSGNGVLKDEKMAVNFFTMAAESGGSGIQYRLGKMYIDGQSVPLDYQLAAKWLTIAAEQGHSEAQFELGVMYQNAQGVPQDINLAAEWYRKAAEQGHNKATIPFPCNFSALFFIQSHIFSMFRDGT